MKSFYTRHQARSVGLLPTTTTFFSYRNKSTTSRQRGLYWRPRLDLKSFSHLEKERQASEYSNVDKEWKLSSTASTGNGEVDYGLELSPTRQNATKTNRRKSTVAFADENNQSEPASMVIQSQFSKRLSQAANRFSSPATMHLRASSPAVQHNVNLLEDDEDDTAPSSSWSGWRRRSAQDQADAEDSAKRRAIAEHGQVRLPDGKEVPLMPASILARKLRGEDLADEDRLHHAVQENHLVQSESKVPFRCLRCFTIFSTVPGKVLNVFSAHREFEEEKKKRDEVERTKKLGFLPNRKVSRGQLDDAERETPTACPKCGSKKVQWLMDYVHRSKHTGSAYAHVAKKKTSRSTNNKHNTRKKKLIAKL